MRNVKTNQMNACRCNSKGAGAKMTSWLNNNFRLLALTLLAVLSSSVCGETYTLVTDASSLKAGDQICFVSTGSYKASQVTYEFTVANTGSVTYSNKNYIGKTDVTITSNTITSENIHPITLGGTSGAWTLLTSDGYVSNGGGNALKFDNTNGQTFSIAISNAPYNATIKSTSSADSMFYYNPNSGSNERFSIYKSAQKPIMIYKCTTCSSCTNTITITKGTPSNGTFNLSQTGEVCIDEGNATVNVTDITPADHYHFSQITATNGSVDNENERVTNISANTAINVTFAEDTKYTISFQDNIQSEVVASKEVYDGETFSFPVLTDKTAATEGTCAEMHYHFMGWVISTHTGEIKAGDIKTGTSDDVYANATYKAVWAAEEQE